MNWASVSGYESDCVNGNRVNRELIGAMKLETRAEVECVQGIMKSRSYMGAALSYGIPQRQWS